MTPSSPFANALAKQAHAPKPKTQARITVTSYQPPPTKDSEYADVRIVFKDGRAYFPSRGRDEQKLIWAIAPVFESPISLSSIVPIVEQIIYTPYTKLTDNEAKAIAARKTMKTDPTLKATRSTSWRNLYKTTVSYLIQTIDEDTEWLIVLHNPTKGKANCIKLPIGTPLEELVKIILEDLKKYPHVLGNTQPTPMQ